MIEGLIKLLAFQVAGEAIVHLLSLPIPGAVVGMAVFGGHDIYAPCKAGNVGIAGDGTAASDAVKRVHRKALGADDI